MLKRSAALLAFIIISVSGFSQSASGAIGKYTYPVGSINIADTSYEDLAPFGKAIGDSRIVMLGEMDNGDGETLKAKARLVRYLHEKLGFTVLAFESEFYSTNWLWDKYKNGEVALQSLWSVWSEVHEFADIANYVKQVSKGDSSLIIAGFDCQIYYEPGVSDFQKQAKALFDTLGYPQDASKGYLETLLKCNDYREAKLLPDTAFKFLRNFTTMVIADIRKSNIDTSSWWVQTFNSMMGNAVNCWMNRDVGVGYNFQGKRMDGTIQDKQMGENVKWLANEKYKGKKIIVWAHNFHISKNRARLDVETSEFRRTAYTTMGTEVSKQLKDEVYILGFTSFDGTSGSPFQRNGSSFDIRPLSRNDLYTNTLADLNFEYAFTDFRPIQKLPVADAAFTMRGWGYQYLMKGNWFNVFDGMFFIKTNKAATALE